MRTYRLMTDMEDLIIRNNAYRGIYILNYVTGYNMITYIMKKLCNINNICRIVVFTKRYTVVQLFIDK